MLDQIEQNKLLYILDHGEYARSSLRKAFGLHNNILAKKFYWHKIASRIEKQLELYSNFEIFCEVKSNKSLFDYETIIQGTAIVPSYEFTESEINIDIQVSPTLFATSLPITIDFYFEFEKLFLLTYIHEVAHTTQIDDNCYQYANFVEYLSNPLEIDAYSSELAFDMFLHDRKRTNCESYRRYNRLKKRDVFREFRDMSMKKYQFLKCINNSNCTKRYLQKDNCEIISRISV